MEFFSQILNLSFEIFEPSQDFPQKFSQYFTELYLRGDIPECINQLNINNIHLDVSEKKEIYSQLLLWMNTDNNYNSHFFQQVNNIMPLKNIIETDLNFQYQIFLMSMSNNYLFKKVLYSTNKWDNPIVIESADISNIQVSQIANMFDYLTVVILSGGKWNLVWFLDWMKSHNKLEKFKSNSCAGYHIWFAIYYCKFQCAKILKDYGFIENSRASMRKMYPCINVMHEYDTVNFNNNSIYLKKKMYDHISFEEFKIKFNEIICPAYKKFLMGTDDVVGFHIDEFIMNWNCEILYYMEYPKKIILNSIVELCNDSSHLFCASLSKIHEKCKSTLKENMINIIYQLYINKKEKCKNIYKKKLICKKLASKIIFKRNETFKTCGVCFEDFVFNDCKTYCKLNCNHFFHSECITEWRKYKNQCPYCRTETNEVIKFNH